MQKKSNMKTFTFTYVEVSIAGEHKRQTEVKALTEKSAWKKLFQVMGNRTFENIQLKG